MPTKGAVVVDVSAAFTCMVATSFNRRRAENMVEIVAIRLLIYPFSDRIEHIAMKLKVLIAKSRMMKDIQNVFHNFIDRDTRVLPRV